MSDPNVELTRSEKLADNSSFFSSKRNKVLITVLVIIALFAALWIWKAIEINNIKKFSAEREEALKQRADTALRLVNIKYLKLVAKPYVWAIRTEIMRGNIDAVNLYANDMVKEKNFQSITVVDDKGIIVSSTDKKLEGKNFSSIGKGAYLTTDSTIVDRINEYNLVVSSPVMGFNKRIGTLIFNYATEKVELGQ
jgi:hypothetical protein